MTWFKVDDGFWCHPKALTLPDAAVALWTRAGSWSAQQLTDGGVPREALAMFRAKPRAADQLVDVGLWAPTVTGWTFHDWTDYQPTRAQVEADRAATAARVAAWRERQRTRKRGDDDGSGPSLAAVT
jgi:hypothetical protein